MTKQQSAKDHSHPPTRRGLAPPLLTVDGFTQSSTTLFDPLSGGMMFGNFANFVNQNLVLLSVFSLSSFVKAKFGAFVRIFI